MNLTKNPKITAKTISHILNVSISTASRYLSDIKKEYNVKILTLWHLNDYLGINTENSKYIKDD